MIGRFPVGMILQHLLVFFLIVVTPLWDRYEIPRLKASTEVRKKIHFYEKIMTASWISALVAGLTIGLAAVTMQRTPGEIAWLDAGSRGAIFMKGMIGGVFLVIFVPALLALGSAKIRDKAGRAAKRLAFLVPSTRV